MAEKVINWDEVFEGHPDSFTDEQVHAANDWRACAIGECAPKKGKKFDKDLDDYDNDLTENYTRYDRTLFELGCAFGTAVFNQQPDVASSIYTAIKNLTRPRRAKAIAAAMGR